MDKFNDNKGNIYHYHLYGEECNFIVQDNTTRIIYFFYETTPNTCPDTVCIWKIKHKEVKIGFIDFTFKALNYIKK